MAGLVVAVDEAFPADVPAGTHPFFAPLRLVARAFSGKVALPDFTLPYQKFSDGCGVFDDAGVLVVSLLPFLFLFVTVFVVFPAPGRCGHWNFGSGFDEVGR